MSRRINWGADATDAKYRTEDTGTPGDFIVAEDTDGNTVLLKYDDTAGEWVYGGPVNMDGADISNVGQLSSTSVSTEELILGDTVKTVEVLTVNFSDPGTPSDGTFNSNKSDTVTKSFNQSFGSVPTVFPSRAVTGGGRGAFSAQNVTTSGFDARYLNYSSLSSIGPTIDFIAVEF